MSTPSSSAVPASSNTHSIASLRMLIRGRVASAAHRQSRLGWLRHASLAVLLIAAGCVTQPPAQPPAQGTAPPSAVRDRSQPAPIPFPPPPPSAAVTPPAAPPASIP